MAPMRAFVRTGAQNRDVELTELVIPEMDEDEVLVGVEAFGVGIHDRYFIPDDVGFPYVIGSEGAGVIRSVRDEVSDFQVGDRVILSSLLHPKGGCWAEYVAAPVDRIVPLPAELSFVHGAALPIAGKTALEVMRALDLEEGDTLFVAGASGAIGTLVIQLARNGGARVVGSASGRNHEYMLSLGAERAVDYSDSDWKGQVRGWMPGGVDAALAIQPGTCEDSVDVVRDGGRAITVSGDPCAPGRDIAVRQFQHRLDLREAIGRIAREVTEGRIRLVIEHTYPFEEAIRALEKTETRHARGKSVVSMSAAP